MNKVEVNEIEKQAEKTIKEKEELEYDVSSYLTKFFFFFLLATFGITIFKLEEKYFDYLSFLVLIGYICPLFQFLYKKKKLEYDEEYQTAKKVIEKYKKRTKEEKLKIELKETFKGEQEKVKRIMEFRNYLNEKVEK